MTANAATFEATIKTLDQASGPLRAITSRIAAMTEVTATAERQLARFDKPEIFRRMSANVGLLRGRFDSLGASIGAVHGRMSSLFSALGPLAALTSVGGLVHLVENVAEARADQLARLQRTGVDPKNLGFLTMAAKSARVPIEDLDKSLAKLSNNIVLAGQGKNKDFLSLFKSAHVSLKDTKGNFRDAGEVMRDFFDVFQKTANGPLRETMARVLAGKGGDKLLPMFLMQKEELDEIAKATKGLTYSYTPVDDKNLKQYSREMAYLKLSVSSLGNAIASQLAPVLIPVVKQMREFFVAHRPEITKAVAEAIKGLTTTLKQFDWDRLGRDLKFIWDGFGTAITAVGGLNRVIEILIAYKLGSWGLSFARSLVRIGIEARATSAALLGVGRAAVAADSTTAFGGLLGRLALMSRSLTVIGAAIAILWPTSTAPKELDEAPPDPKHPRRADDSEKLSREIYERRNLPHWNWTIARPGAPLPAGPMRGPAINFNLPSTMPTIALPNGLPTLGPVFGPQLPALLRQSALPPSQLPSSLFPSSSLPQGGSGADGGGGQLKISIDVKNLPPGSNVSVDTGHLTNLVETNVGYANPLANYGR